MGANTEVRSTPHGAATLPKKIHPAHVLRGEGFDGPSPTVAAPSERRTEEESERNAAFGSPSHQDVELPQTGQVEPTDCTHTAVQPSPSECPTARNRSDGSWIALINFFRIVFLYLCSAVIRGRFIESQGAIEKDDKPLTPPPEQPAVDHSRRAVRLTGAALALRAHFKRTGAQGFLNMMIALLEKALELRPQPHPDRVSSLTELAIALSDRYHRSGSAHDLQKSICLLTEALELCPPGSPFRSDSLNNLACSLGDRYHRSGSLDDLHERVRLLTEALELDPPGSPARASTLSNLANALRDRYRRSGASEDLEEMVRSLHGIGTGVTLEQIVIRNCDLLDESMVEAVMAKTF